MAEPHVIGALRNKRAELAGTLRQLEQQLAGHRANLAHLDATMRLFGIVKLTGTSLKRAEATIEMLCRSRNALSACLLMPDVEGLTTNCAIRLCGQQVSARMEMTMNECVSGKEVLSLPT
jgi:hypothetical protein